MSDNRFVIVFANTGFRAMSLDAIQAIRTYDKTKYALAGIAAQAGAAGETIKVITPN